MSARRARRRADALEVSRKKRRNQMIYGGLAGCGLIALVIAMAAVLSLGGPDGYSASASEDLAEDFSFDLYQGERDLGADELNLSDLRGKPVVLNFWAGLCPPCRAEMPDLQKFHEESGDEIIMLGIDVGRFNNLGSKRDAENLLEELSVTYPAGFTRDGSVMRDYEVFSMPTTVFINSRGEVFQKWSGVITRDVLVSLTDSMANAEARSAS